MTSFIDTTTGRIAYDAQGPEPGPGDPPPLVLLASGAHDRRDGDELRAELDDLRTIALDWPAHGDSPAAAEASAMQFADVAEEAVARLAPDGAILVGNSVGGF